MKNAKPNINVTPLIDVLLVLLIIFMVITPTKPSDFKTRIPDVPQDKSGDPNPHTLVVAVGTDKNLLLNNEKIEDSAELIGKLAKKFRERTENGIFAENTNEIQKTVFVKAPRNLAYGEVVKVVDAVKTAGAEPISLQIDDLQ